MIRPPAAQGYRHRHVGAAPATVTNVAVPSPLGALLTRLIDYAGLFPPAGLSMEAAVEAYAAHRESESSFALARFVTPVARLEEFAAVLPTDPRARWPVSAIAGDDPQAAVRAIQAFNERHRGRAIIDALETRAVLGAVDGLTRYIEIPIDGDLAGVAASGARAKVRTGGLTADKFPAATKVAGFLHDCFEAGVAFKATAGLHHPLRSVRPFTNEPASPTGWMHGFVNLFLAAGLARHGVSEGELAELLEETSPASFRVEADGMGWSRHVLTTEEIRETREQFAISFGSCSFEEPIEDLRRLGWL